MFGSEVPPRRTIIFDGGQFVEPLAAPAGGAGPPALASGGAEADEAEPAAVETVAGAAALLQLAETVFFLCRGFLADG